MILRGLIITVINAIIAMTMTTDGITHTGDMITDEIHIQTHRDAMTGDTIVRATVIAGRRLATEHHGGLEIASERVADYIQPRCWKHSRGLTHDSHRSANETFQVTLSHRNGLPQPTSSLGTGFALSSGGQPAFYSLCPRI
jgi:hypothetical protein